MIIKMGERKKEDEREEYGGWKGRRGMESR